MQIKPAYPKKQQIKLESLFSPSACEVEE